ncbi:hypothetical protein SERLA73DRAFT_154892 [Serpula lacrymans var. lacrymans S7.3]|uniref:Uncharacterized protein n=1 Tax=Serpula lacrymans var. lacrymans (strain S7.3) TaxID=936435 RepID=F8Q7F2_SERL3|nr:hypothetical protein SERLA73DRAFT_154892 [Serpula lacrymans var. lacrymans S7.3]
MMKGMAGGSSGSGNRGPNGRYQGEGALEKKAEMVEEKKDGTGTTYGGAGQRMEVDKVKYRAEGRYASLPVDNLDACSTNENEITLFKNAQDLKQKEQSKEESLKGKRAEKIPKTETTKVQNEVTQLGSTSDTDTLTRSEEVRHTSNKNLETARKVPKGDRTIKSAAKKETTEGQNVVAQLGSTNDTDTTTSSKEKKKKGN